jgi:histidinol-phosphate aminotransferase
VTTDQPSPTRGPHRAGAIEPAARLAGLRPYQPPTSRWPIDLALDANEGPPPSRETLDAAKALAPERLRRYPHAADLERSIAHRLGVEPERVVVTNGGDDAIDRLCRAVLEPGRSILAHVPTFEMILHSARLAGGSIRSVEWIDGPFPTARFLAEIAPDTTLVSLVTPNNPTGSAIPAGDVLAIVDAAHDAGAVALVDLAYVEFADEDPTPELLDRPNAVLVRTFSKARGLAGLRVGYAIAPERLAGWMRTTGGPYPVSSVSLALAGASLESGDAPSTVDRARLERDELTTLLRTLGAPPLPSQANFVSVHLPAAADLHARLASLGISVRAFPTRPELADTLRITLPVDADDFDRLCGALSTALRPEALLLDLDGVLADVGRSYRAAIVATARAFGVDLTTDDIARAKAAGDANNDWILTHRLLTERGVVASLDEVTRRFQAIYLGDAQTPGLRETETLIPGRDLLERLSARARLGIVTGRPRDEAAWFLERAGVADLFPVVVAMEDAPAKPAPDPIRLAMERLGATAAWMVGDTPDDLRAARAAGALPVGIPAPCDDPSPERRVLENAGAWTVLDSLEQLETLLP